MIVASANALAHRVAAAAAFRARHAAPVEFPPATPPPSPSRRREPRAGSASGISAPQYRPARPRRRERLACPSWWFHCVKLAPNPGMKSLRDQIIGDWRRKSAADADRPRVFRKQPVTTHRCRQSAPTRSASATCAGSASESTAPRPPRMSGRCACANASARRSTVRGSGCRRPGGGGNYSGGRSEATGTNFYR